MRNAFRVLLALPLLAFVTAPAPADPAPAPAFPFVIPWDDATPRTATDVSSLNDGPAGSHGFIVPKGGHFVESKTGKRVRFLGVNFAAKAAFPAHADAEKVAARLAKLGVNIVRLHHMDNDDWGADAHIWDDSYKDRRHINPAQLDKLDYLISQLKKNGIYANINLHVSRQFSAADGFPPSVSDIPTSFDKRVDEFDPRMIQLQKDYARDLLTHINPYTHLSYAADPGVAVVEINNENSLVGDPWATLGAGLDTLPEPFRGELVAKWNAWLQKKYATDAKLQAAWLHGLTPTGPAINYQAQLWSLEHQGTSNASLLQTSGGSSEQITVSQVDGTDWHVQAHPTGLDFHEGDTYTVAFRAKADALRPMAVAAGLDQADWHNIGLSETAALTTDWKTFRYTFDAHDAVANHGRVAFTLGNQTGTVWISDLQVRPGADGAGLLPGQSLTTKTVDIPTSATKPQHADWIAFLADTERAYADEMRAYLKDTLHVHANVICSQISWGGLTGLNREANMDFADNHAYWQHPSFPGKPWDSQNWTIGNTSMVADMANGGGGTLRDLAENRVAGKPYSVSEYNEPAPNDFQAEAVPVLATFAAFQDWDMIYLFDYGDYGASAANDKIQGYFAVGSNPAKTAFLPAAAMIFRGGEVPPTVMRPTLWVSQAQLTQIAKADEAWRMAGRNKPASVLSAFGIHVEAPNAPTITMHPEPPVTLFDIFTDAPPDIEISNPAAGARYTTQAPTAQETVGYVGGQSVNVGTLTLAFPAFGNNFAAVTLTQMPNGSQLLTLVGKVENQGMVWNAAHNSVSNQWGHGPTMAEGIPATVTLRTDGTRHVFALDGTGKRTQEVPATFADGTLTFTVGPQYQTLWYEIAQ